MDIIDLKLAKNKIRTNHILHFILTLLSGGFWGIIWIIRTFQNQNKIKDLDNKISELELKAHYEHNIK